MSLIKSIVNRFASGATAISIVFVFGIFLFYIATMLMKFHDVLWSLHENLGGVASIQPF